MNNPPDVAQAYFNAWNAHDAGSIASLFTEEGEYHDPSIKIRGRDIGTYAQSLWDAFPDLVFELSARPSLARGWWQRNG